MTFLLAGVAIFALFAVLLWRWTSSETSMTSRGTVLKTVALGALYLLGLGAMCAALWSVVT